MYKTFKEAADSYIEFGGSKDYLPKIIEEIGNKSLNEIFPFNVKQLAIKLFPEAKNSTRNRQAI